MDSSWEVPDSHAPSKVALGVAFIVTGTGLAAFAFGSLAVLAAGLALVVLGVLVVVRSRQRLRRRERTRTEGLLVEGALVHVERVGTSNQHNPTYRHVIRAEGPSGPVELVHEGGMVALAGAWCAVRYLPGQEDDAVMVGVRRVPAG